MSSSNQVLSPEEFDSVESPPVFICPVLPISKRTLLATLLLTGHISLSSPAASPPVQGDLEPLSRRTPTHTQAKNQNEIESTTFLLRSVLAREEVNLDLARKSLKRAWALNLASPSLAVRLAYDALEIDDANEAQTILNETSNLCPKDPSLKIHQAIISLRYQSNPHLALGHAEAAYRLAPTSPRTIHILTETLSELGHLARIEQLLSACASIPSQDPDFWADTSENFAKHLFTEGELPHPQTLARFNAVLKRSIAAGLQSRSHTEKNADVCIRSGQFPEAVLLYRRCLDLSDDRPAQLRALTHHKLAKTLLSIDRDTDALLAASQAVALDETNPAHLELRADIHLELKNWQLALSDLSRGAALEPDSLELHLRTANLEIKLRDFESAATRCRSMSNGFPSAPTPKILGAIALASQGKHREAVAQLDAAEALLTESEQSAIGPEILFPLGVAAEKAGLTDKAVSLLKKCVAQESEFASDAANHLAFMWIDAGQNLEEAGQLIRSALQSKPESPYYRDTYGWWLFKNGKSRAALEELLRALKQMPTPEKPDVHSHLADVYSSLNDSENTAFHLKAVAEARPDTPGLAERIETLRIAHPEIR